MWGADVPGVMGSADEAGCGRGGVAGQRGHARTAVSYTHLDVYKRQVEHVDHGAGVDVAYELDDVLALIGRYDGVKQVHPVAAVSLSLIHI